MQDPGSWKVRSPSEGVWSGMARHAHLGLQLALSTGLFLAAGWWLDGRLGSTPAFTIAGALLGAAAGFYSMIRQLLGPADGRAEPGHDEREAE